MAELMERRVRRGEVWWADLDERRLVVVLSADDPAEIRAMQVVPPAGVPLGGLGAEVTLSDADPPDLDGVVRVALPRDDFIPCTWLITFSAETLIGVAGTLSPAKLDELGEVLRRAGIE